MGLYKIGDIFGTNFFSFDYLLLFSVPPHFFQFAFQLLFLAFQSLSFAVQFPKKIIFIFKKTETHHTVIVIIICNSIETKSLFSIVQPKCRNPPLTLIRVAFVPTPFARPKRADTLCHPFRSSFA